MQEFVNDRVALYSFLEIGDLLLKHNVNELPHVFSVMLVSEKTILKLAYVKELLLNEELLYNLDIVLPSNLYFEDQLHDLVVKCSQKCILANEFFYYSPLRK